MQVSEESIHCSLIDQKLENAHELSRSSEKSFKVSQEQFNSKSLPKTAETKEAPSPNPRTYIHTPKTAKDRQYQKVWVGARHLPPRGPQRNGRQRLQIPRSNGRTHGCAPGLGEKLVLVLGGAWSGLLFRPQAPKSCGVLKR